MVVGQILTHVMSLINMTILVYLQVKVRTQPSVSALLNLSANHKLCLIPIVRSSAVYTGCTWRQPGHVSLISHSK